MKTVTRDFIVTETERPDRDNSTVVPPIFLCASHFSLETTHGYQYSMHKNDIAVSAATPGGVRKQSQKSYVLILTLLFELALDCECVHRLRSDQWPVPELV